MNYVLLAIILVIVALVILLYLDIFRYLRITMVRTPEDLLEYGRVYNHKEKVPSDSRVVVSLTTTPDRISEVTYTLKSLLDQTKSVDNIYLCIPYKLKRSKREYKISSYLEELSKVCPKFKIKRILNDYGPITKISPIFEEPPDTRLVYVDDDYIYGRNMIETMVKSSMSYSNVAWCLHGINFGPSQTNTVDIVQGYGGVLIRPQFFDLTKILDYDGAPEASFFEDDFWISGLLAGRSIVRKKLPFSGRTFGLPYCPNMKSALCHNENAGKRNANIMTEYFRAVW